MCNKSFNKLRSLMDHELIHAGEKPYLFDTETPYSCGTCGKIFSQLNSLKTHVLIHTGDKPYRCETCDKSFRLIDQLKRHKFIHTGDKPHRCESCDKSFRRIDQLKRHKLIHTREKPYHCEVCYKLFSRLLSFSWNWKFRLESLAIPSSYPLDGICSLHLTSIKDSYTPLPCSFHIRLFSSKIINVRV